MSSTVWNNGSWRVSNGGLTATSPNTGVFGQPTGGAINAEYASTAIPDHAKTYFEIRVSGAALLTAFGTGISEHNTNFGPFNPTVVDPNSITNSNYIEASYNLGIANGGHVVYDPQDNAHFAQTHPGAIAAPNQWSDGAVIGVEVDRVNNQATFYLNGVQQGGPFSIQALQGETLYPFVSSWFRAGPQATIIANPSDTPSGYTNLDQSGGSNPNPTPVPAPNPPTPPNGNTITVNEPNPLVAGQTTLTGTESDPSQPVFLDWRTFGGAPSAADGDAVQASVNTDGSFSASVNIDNPNIPSTLYAGNGGTLSAQWSGTPVAGSNPTPTPTPPSPGGNTITVNEPPNLQVGQDVITGKETDPSQPVFLDWRTFPPPDPNDTVQATVAPDGTFSAVVNIDHSDVPSTMYASNGGAFTKEWTATPGTGPSFISSPNTITVNDPPSFKAVTQTITGRESDPTQPVFLDWNVGRTPNPFGSFVQANVDPNTGNFSAQVNIDHGGRRGTMFATSGPNEPIQSLFHNTPGLVS